ncbi:hypothetical protein BD410DRAFT_788040 [Rickenella mellea]|uniref:MYND-type domain-containing protein n=1 Tax=Rickenella mellea TaxID=50990 RepID=A0A4Y7Q697_9AGAM|nr:hypothetical protein BD410DRAFT_788040 [Rickenella mellea]
MDHFEHTLANEFEALLRDPASKTQNAPSPASLNLEPPINASGHGRLRVEEKHRLPARLLKSRTKEEIERMFDSDGYLLEVYNALPDSDVNNVNNICWVCKEHGKRVCSGCKMFTYCSTECQKSHWTEHKPMCQMIRNPTAYTKCNPYEPDSIRQLGSSSFTNMVEISRRMREDGKRYRNIQALLEDWLAHFKHGGMVETGSTTGSQMWALGRNADGDLEILEHSQVKPRQTPRPKNRKSGAPEGTSNLASYLAMEIEAFAKKGTPKLLNLYSSAFNVAIVEVGVGNMEPHTVRRGAEIIQLESRRWSVIQFLPDGLQKSDEFINGRPSIQQYSW